MVDAPDLVRQEEAGGDAPALERRVRGDIVRLGLGPLRRRGEGPGQQERGVLADLDEVPRQDVGELDRRMGVDLARAAKISIAQRPRLAKITTHERMLR